MICPTCSQAAGAVVDSRMFEGRQRRRYKCRMTGCERVWETVEVGLEDYEAVEEIRAFRVQLGLAGRVVPRLLSLHGELQALMEALTGSSLKSIRQSATRKTKGS